MASKESFIDKPAMSWFITVLIVYSVICFSLETLPTIQESTRIFLFYSEVFVVGVFTVEYFYRIYLAENRLKFIFSFYGIIDLLAILPFYLATAIDLRSLRLLRMLRLFKILKLMRYSQAIKRFAKAMYSAKEELIVFTFTSFVMFYLAAVGIYHFEHEAQPEVYKSIFDCLWWAVATLTTVGYGDIYPITTGGRIFTLVVLMIGLGLVAVPTSIIVSALNAIRQEEKN